MTMYHKYLALLDEKLFLSRAFKYASGIETDHEYGRHSCTCGNDYCRCGTIVNARVTGVNVTRFLNIIFDFGPSWGDMSLLHYCIDRTFRNKGFYNLDNWNVEITQGYYGEELGEVTFDSGKLREIKCEYYALAAMSSGNMVKHVLAGEYGFILPSIEDKTEATILTVGMDQIEFPNEYYMKKLQGEDDFYPEEYKLARGVVVDEHPAYEPRRYKVIDGYHRLLQAKKLNMTEVDVVVLS